MNEIDAFSNEPVDPASLPDFRRVALNEVAEGYRTWALVNYTGFWLFLALALAVVVWLPIDALSGLGWAAVVPLVFAALGAVYAWFDPRYRAWGLRERDLIYRYGVIWRKTVIVPFARIQHVEAVQGPLERKLGLMRLKCFTAGGQTADLTVKGLDRVSARRVRQYLLEQIGDPADGSDDDQVTVGDTRDSELVEDDRHAPD